jgi:hypothetical protein
VLLVQPDGSHVASAPKQHWVVLKNRDVELGAVAYTCNSSYL